MRLASCLALLWALGAGCQPRSAAAGDDPNRAPVIGNVSFNPAKFVRACEPVEICVSASDPDGDPLTVAWQRLDEAAPLDGPTVTRSDASGNTLTECARFLPRRAAAYQLEVRVSDTPPRRRGVVLRDSLKFPLYAAEGTRPCP